MRVSSTLHFYLTLFDQHDTHFTLKVLAFPAAPSYLGAARSVGRQVSI